MTAVSEERPVAVLVQLASQFDSKIHLISGNKKINAKSIMGMMSLGFAEGEPITVQAEGPDEEKACEQLAAYIQNENNPVYISLLLHQ